jgi:tetratricopeptide (TPR) repeat protein
MKLKKRILWFCLLVVVEMPFNNLFAQNVQSKPTRQSSFEAFSQGNYEKAYNEFRELLLTYSKDPLYKYYSGVCLVMLNRDPGEAIKLLGEALQGGDAVRSLPSEGLFYLGRAQQMAGRFSEATQSFDQYTAKVGKKAAKEMGVPDFLQQCAQKKGQVEASELKPAADLKNIKTDTSKTVVKPIIKEPVQKTAEKTDAPKVVLPKGYENLLNEAIKFQAKADSLLELAGDQRKELEKISPSEKSVLKDKISNNEKLSASFQKLADQKYREAQLALNPGQDTSKLLKMAADKRANVVKDSAGMSDYKKTVNMTDKRTDTTKTAASSVKVQQEVFAFFEASARPVTDPKEKIIVDPEVPAGLIFRIQIAVFRNPVALGYFKGLSPVYGFKIEGTDKTIYYAGMFRKSADAAKAIPAVKSKGFKDSFVVPLLDSKRVSPDRAVLLEKEWGKKPFYSIESVLPVAQTDTITRTLTFRVEVIRSLRPLVPDVVDGIRKIAANKGLDIQFLEDGEIAYLVGKFITFETAAEYADLLIRNGYRDSKVVARLGEKEISVETAKKLFEKLK